MRITLFTTKSLFSETHHTQFDSVCWRTPAVLYAANRLFTRDRRPLFTFGYLDGTDDYSIF